MARRYDNLWQTMERFRQDRHGGVLVLSAVLISALVGFTGLAVDVGSWYGAKRDIQTAADAAALSAAFEMSRGETDKDAIKAAAKKDAKLNGSDVSNGATVDIQIATGNESVTVVITEQAPLYFSTLFLDENPTIAARGTASVGASATCILALSPNAKDAIKVNNGTLIADGCTVHANSSHNSFALDVESGGVLNADQVTTVGDYENTGSMSNEPETGAEVIADPLKDMAAPLVGACEADKQDISFETGSHTLEPGVYCGGINVSGDAQVTFEPGDYTITGGKLKSAGTASITGIGVSFYLDGKQATLDLSGQGATHLSAPTEGDMAGVLFFGDRDNKNSKHNISGGAGFYFEGTMYLPSGDLEVTGNGAASTNSPYTIVIAQTYKFGGNGGMAYNSNYGDSDVPLPAAIAGAGRVALTE